MGRKLSQQDEQYIRRNYRTMTDKEMGLKRGHPRGTITSFRKRVGLRISQEEAKRRRGQGKAGRTTSTPEIDEFLTNNYLTINVNQLSIQIGRSEMFVKTRLRQLDLIIPPHIIEERKIESRIKKGNVPPNKGKKQTDYMSPDSIARTVATRFKKGRTNHNELSDGVIKVRHGHKNRNERAYKWIRISKGNWEMLHVHNWVKTNGPVPEGFIIVFRTEDTMNCEIGNLEMISRAEHAIRNSSHDNPTDGRVATYMATKSRIVDTELKEELLKRPDILELKRQQLLLNKAIKNERKNNSNSRRPRRKIL